MRNVTCSSHGYCLQNQNNTIQCKCNIGFSGDLCYIESSSVRVVKYTQWTTTIICFICIASFWLLIIGSDVLDYLKIGHEHIDMDKWRSEKFRGVDNQNNGDDDEYKDHLKRNEKNGKRIHFKYVP